MADIIDLPRRRPPVAAAAWDVHHSYGTAAGIEIARAFCRDQPDALSLVALADGPDATPRVLFVISNNTAGAETINFVAPIVLRALDVAGIQAANFAETVDAS